jgi:hypothetical protein
MLLVFEAVGYLTSGFFCLVVCQIESDAGL